MQNDETLHTRAKLMKAAKALDIDLDAMSKRLKDDWMDFWNPFTDKGTLYDVARSLRMTIDFSKRNVTLPLPDGSEISCPWEINGLTDAGAIIRLAGEFADWIENNGGQYR